MEHSQINIFELLKKALDKYSFSTEFIADNVVQTVQELKAAYHENSQSIDYSNGLTQFVYIQRYMAFRVLALEAMFRDPRYNLHSIFDPSGRSAEKEDKNGDRISVVSVGSGPATDMVAILKYCSSIPTNPAIDFKLFDLVNWRPAIDKIYDTYDQREEFTFEFEHNFDFHSDIDNKNNFWSCIEQARLIVFSWLFSDIKGPNYDENRVIGNVEKIFQRSQPGTYFLIIDSHRCNAINHLQVAGFLSDATSIRNENGSLPFNVEESCECLGKYSEIMGVPHLKGPIEPLIFMKNYNASCQ